MRVLTEADKKSLTSMLRKVLQEFDDSDLEDRWALMMAVVGITNFLKRTTLDDLKMLDQGGGAERS